MLASLFMQQIVRLIQLNQCYVLSHMLLFINFFGYQIDLRYLIGIIDLYLELSSTSRERRQHCDFQVFLSCDSKSHDTRLSKIGGRWYPWSRLRGVEVPWSLLMVIASWIFLLQNLSSLPKTLVSSGLIWWFKVWIYAHQLLWLCDLVSTHDGPLYM